MSTPAPVSNPTCPSWSDVSDQVKDHVWFVESVTAGCSIVVVVLALAYMLTRYICVRFFGIYSFFGKDIRFYSPAERLIAFTFIPVLIEMIGKYLTNSGYINNVYIEPLCAQQTGLVEFGNMTSVCLTILFSWNLVTIIRAFQNGNLRDLQRTLFRRDIFFVILSFVVGLIFAIVSENYSTFSKYWCWVGDPNNTTNDLIYNLLFFYVWMWAVFLLALGILLYAIVDYFQNWEQHKQFDDINAGCIAAFMWFLIINLLVWLIASVNRFYTLSTGCYSLGLGVTQAITGTLRGFLLVLVYAVLSYNKTFEAEKEESIKEDYQQTPRREMGSV